MEILMDRQTNRRNYTNFERNLAMMVIYLPVKFEFDWTNHFRVTVQKRKCGRTDKTDVLHINLIGGLVTRNPPNKYGEDPTLVNSIGHFHINRSCITPFDINILMKITVNKYSTNQQQLK